MRIFKLLIAGAGIKAIEENPLGFVGTITLITGVVIGVLTVLEKLFDKKGPGHIVVGWVWGWFTAPLKVTKVLSVLLTKIESIEKEVKHNGGGSIKDGVARIEKDVSDIRTAQEVALERRKVEYDLNPIPIFINDAHNNLVYINQAWCDAIGCRNSAEMMGRGWLRAVPDYDKDEMEKQAERIEKNPVPFSGEVVLQHLTTRKELKFWCISKPIISGGKIIEIIGSLKIIPDGK